MPASRKKPAKKRSKNAKPRRSVPGKEVSVMAWLEDPYGQVLMVKQTAGKKLWALPGGKVRRNESLLGALKREVKEETGLVVTTAAPLDMFDRTSKGAVSILYRVLVRKALPVVPKSRIHEISACTYKGNLPSGSTPSARYFWQRAQRSFEPFSMLQ